MAPKAATTPKKDVTAAPRTPAKGVLKKRPPKKQQVSPESEDFNDANFDPGNSSPEAATPQPLTGTPLKAIKAKERALRDKVALVTSIVDTPLAKDDGILVDCFHHVLDKSAPVWWYQLLHRWSANICSSTTTPTTIRIS